MISQLSAKYQFSAIDAADTTDGKVTNRALLSAESAKVHRYVSHTCCVGSERFQYFGSLLLNQATVTKVWEVYNMIHTNYLAQLLSSF